MLSRLQFFYDKIFCETYLQVSKYDSDPEISPTFIVTMEQALNLYFVCLLVSYLFNIDISYIKYSIAFFMIFFFIYNFNRYMNKEKRNLILNQHKKPNIRFKIFSYIYLILSIWLPLIFILKFFNPNSIDL